MATTDAALLALMKAIAAGDTDAARAMLKASPGLARTRMLKGATRQTARAYWFPAIGHYAYAGDTSLHVAAAAYQLDLVKALIAAGADISARNRRGAEPLHYASDGGPGTPSWNPKAQAAVVARLISAGADPNALDNSGVAPIHRAVRTRCSSALKALLASGARAGLKNKSGSTPMDLAARTTGRGGSGSVEAKAEQVKIIRLLEAHA